MTGCSASATSSAPKAEKTLAAKGDLHPKPAAALRDGGTLRLPLQSFPVNWNTGEVDGSLKDGVDIMSTLMLSPYRIGADGEPELDQDLVTKVEVSQKPFTVTYTINEKAHWSDGSPITWKDFEADWKTQRGADPAFQIGSSTGYDQISSVTAGTSAKQAVVTFAKPFGDWKSLFGLLFPASVISTPAGFNTGYADTIPVTSGPFMVKKIDKTAQTVTVTRDPGWWGAKPKLDTVVFRALSGDADIDAFLNDEIDVVSASTSDRYGRVASAKDVSLRAAPSATFTHLDMSSSGLLKDTEIRLAVQNAVDRDAIAKVLFGSLPYHVDVLDNHLLLSTDPGYQSNAGSFGRYDAHAAATRLDRDGWKAGSDGIRTKNGTRLELTMTVPAGAKSSSDAAQIVQSELAAVGIKLDVDTVPVNSFFSDHITPGKYDLTMFVWAGTGYHSSGASIFTSATSGQNYGRVSSPQVDRLLTAAVGETDDSRAEGDYNAADRQIWALGHSLPIAQSPKVVATRPTLANYGAFAGAADVDWTAVGYLK